MCGSFQGQSGRADLTEPRQLMNDAVEKGKNEPVQFFPCAPVEAGFP
jgi:hypothetical protein